MLRSPLRLLAPALSYYILQTLVIRAHGANHALKRAVGSDWKGTLSPVVYCVGIAAAYAGVPRLGQAAFVVVALIWLVPDRRIERGMPG